MYKKKLFPEFVGKNIKEKKNVYNGRKEKLHQTKTNI